MLAVDNGWPKALQACQGRIQLDKNKKGSSNAKEDRSMVFGLHLL